MNPQEFDRLFSTLYFALVAHSEISNVSFRGAHSVPKEGYGTIEFGEQLVLTITAADLEAFRKASGFDRQTMLDGLIGQSQALFSEK